MHPILLKIGNISIYTYGFFIAVGFVSGILLAKKEAERRGIDPDRMMDLAFYIIIAAIIGSRLFYVLMTPKTFIGNPLDVFKVWEGGLVFYGGFIGAVIAAVWYIRRQSLDMWKIADSVAPAIALGQFFGRLGCFSAGCCYGKICDQPWAVTFHDPNSLAPVGIPLHPTQLYHALGNALIFATLWTFRKRTRFNGQLFWMYVMIYGGVRAALEIFRNDFRGHFFFQMISISQVIGIAMAASGTAMLVILNRKNA
ncbi:MAG: prolipoprotein diacylglyceryl transferase [Desulfobacterales bacterium]